MLYILKLKIWKGYLISRSRFFNFFKIDKKTVHIKSKKIK